MLVCINRRIIIGEMGVLDLVKARIREVVQEKGIYLKSLFVQGIFCRIRLHFLIEMKKLQIKLINQLFL